MDVANRNLALALESQRASQVRAPVMEKGGIVPPRSVVRLETSPRSGQDALGMRLSLFASGWRVSTA
jgi:hypothetical protein